VELMRELDGLLRCHPLHRLDRWVRFARAWGDTPAEADYYERDAKRQVTVWGGDTILSDYAAKLWSGLVGGYYRGRWEAPDVKAFEEQWIESPFRDEPSTKDPLVEARRLFDSVRNR
jgi:alpha-N-acetylglucosaminidase